MELNKIIFGGLAVGCLAAAAAGGYLAADRMPGARADATVAAPVELATPPTGPGAVAESEGLITPEAPAPPTVTAESPATARQLEVEAPKAEAEAPVVAAPRRREAVARPSRSAPAPAPSPVTVTPTRPTRTARNEPAAPSAPPATAQNGGGMWEARPSIEPERAPVAEPEPEPPPAPEFVELVVPSDAVLGLQIERTVTSEIARVEDRVDARVTRDVRVGDRVAIPAGSLVQGSVMEVERGGKVRDRSKLGIRFHTVVLGDGSRLAIKTESVIREGGSPAKESAAKIGGAAAGGAILGAILGGRKGAVIGGSIGAAGGTAATLAGDRQAAVLSAGSTVTVRVQQPVRVSIEK